MLCCSVDSAGVAMVQQEGASASNSHSKEAEQSTTVLSNSTVESLGFGDLQPHVLETLMYHVLQLGDVDAVRSCRLVCKAWHSAGVTLPAGHHGCSTMVRYVSLSHPQSSCVITRLHPSHRCQYDYYPSHFDTSQHIFAALVMGAVLQWPSM